MKKFALVLALSIVAVIAFAAEPAPAVTASLSGDASVTFTMDLDSSGTTMTNATSAKLKVTLVPKDSDTHAGEGAVYGEIKLKDFVAEAENAAITPTGGGVDYAKIVGNNWYVKISSTDDTIDYESMTKKGVTGLVTLGAGGNGVKNAIDSTGGIVAGLSLPDLLNVDLGLFSMTDTTDGEDENAYGISLKLDVKAVEGLTAQAGMNVGFGTGAATALNDNLGFGVKVGYKVSLSDTMYLEPTVALDAVMNDDDTTSMAIGNAVRLGLGGSDEIDNSILKKVFSDKSLDGLTVGYTVSMSGATGADPVIDVNVSLANDSLVDGLVFAALFEMANVTSDTAAENALGVAAAYTIMDKFTPYFGMKTDLTNNDETYVYGGLGITDIVPMVDLSIDYASGNLAADPAVKGTVGVKVSIAY